MDVIYAEKIVDCDGSCVALGNFDGLHIAHIKVIGNAISEAKKRNLKSGVLLFEENTKNLTRGKRIELITPNEAKLELLEREKPDFVYIRKFTAEFMRLTPEEFIKLLVKNVKPKVISVGYDYRFGHKAAGDVQTLREFGKKYGFDVIVTDRITVDKKTVSSTYIRALIKSGDMEETERFLGRRYCVEGIVVHGKENGREMGLPTANVDYDKNMALPKEGVYAGITYVDGRRLKCVINVGKNLTFDANDLTIESHILDFNEDIYDKYIRVSFAKRLRGVIKFNNMDELKEQINSDIEKTRKMTL